MGAGVEYRDFLEFVKARRTTRAIKPDPVPDEMVMQVLEAARWAPSGFNVQPAELLVVRDLELRIAVKKIVEDWIESDFYALEATREKWQGAPWTLETHGRLNCPLAPLYVFILGDTRRKVGLPMNMRYDKQKGESIFETSLANAFMYLWLAAHSLGLAAQPVSTVKSSAGPGVGQASAQPSGLHLHLRVARCGIQRSGRRPLGQADAASRRDSALRSGE